MSGGRSKRGACLMRLHRLQLQLVVGWPMFVCVCEMDGCKSLKIVSNFFCFFHFPSFAFPAIRFTISTIPALSLQQSNASFSGGENGKVSLEASLLLCVQSGYPSQDHHQHQHLYERPASSNSKWASLASLEMTRK